MKRVLRNEILGLGDYETIRDRFRARVIEEKKLRRVSLGPQATCLFENHDTVLMQIQEMLRTERITKESSVLHELETYNAILGSKGELAATVMIEIDDRDAREAFLTSAKGFERHVALVVNGERCSARWDPARELPDRTSAVHYLQFPLSGAAARAITARDAKVELVVDHPAYAARVSLPPATVASLAEDLE